MPTLFLHRDNIKGASGIFNVKTRKPLEILLDGAPLCTIPPGGEQSFDIAPGYHELAINAPTGVYALQPFSASVGQRCSFGFAYDDVFNGLGLVCLVAVFAADGLLISDMKMRMPALLAFMLVYYLIFSTMQYRFLKFREG
jgi:hypothetical protein